MAKDLAIILNSGSVNSAVATAVAAQRYRLVMLYAELNTQAGSRARSAYEQQVGHFKPYRDHVLPMDYLAPLSQTSAASAAASDPRSRGALAAQMLEMLTLVASAARFAAHYQASAIYIGLSVGVQGDDLAQAGEYVQIWNELLQLPCNQAELEVTTPLLELEPWQVVELGYQVSAPFEKTWSCVEEGPDPCWACRGCRDRESAFQQAAKPDPLRGAKRQ
jgi:7-cyano-7-deazaguanine synthase